MKAMAGGTSPLPVLSLSYISTIVLDRRPSKSPVPRTLTIMVPIKSRPCWRTIFGKHSSSVRPSTHTDRPDTHASNDGEDGSNIVGKSREASRVPALKVLEHLGEVGGVRTQ